MKTPLHHAIVRRSFGPAQIVAITTEKSRHWYGRTDDDSATHGSWRDILSRHATREEAESRLSVMRGIEQQYALLSDRISAAYSRLHRLHEDAIRTAATGAVPPPLPSIEIVWSDA